jgi:ectoine hydroxylase-related dioxygenase (phytanoyl-CoA dioxygenase family)
MPVLYEVSDQQKGDYARDGAVCLRGVIPGAVCEAMLEATLDYIESGKVPVRADMREKNGRYVTAIMMAESDSRFLDFVTNSALPGVAAQLMDSNVIRFFYDQFFVIEPGTVRSTPWHNDLPFYPFAGNDIISLWVALTPVTRETSPLQYLAGSHLEGKYYQAVPPTDVQAGHTSGLETCPNYSDPELQRGKRILSWVMEPGDVLAHHALTAHGAPRNMSTDRRRAAISIRYLGNDVQYRPREDVPNKRTYNARPGDYPADDAALPVMQIR